MKRLETIRIGRRTFLVMTAGSAAGLVAAACTDDDPSANPTPAPATTSEPAAETTSVATASNPGALTPTPACGDDDEPTIAQTEGPYFTPNSPERASLLEPGMAGERLVVSGAVLSTDCTPIDRALVDFWQCDDAGVYDNEGYRLRGHQFTGAQGQYRFETIVPGVYPGRTRHIHVKVQAPGEPVLTTQLYFPDEPGNANDGIFDERLVLALEDTAGGKVGAFNFVVYLG